MAKTNDIAAAKARKQKIILAVFGVALVGLAVLQVPKLMGGDSQPAAASTTETAADSAAAATTAPASVPVAVSITTVTAKPAVYVAGVGIPVGPSVRVATNQLASFTLFEAKDPFVQQVGEAGAGDAVAAVTPDAEAEAAGGDGAGAIQAAKPAPVTYATIMLDGKPQQLQVKEKFPKNDPMFVLVSLKKKQAKIGVAGGSFDDGQNVTLALGKKLTLVNTATGVRYELKLVYTGTAPETIEGFSTGTSEQPAPGTTVDASAPAATTDVTATSTP